MHKLLVFSAVSILLCGCVGKAKIDRQAELLLAPFHTTCLKQGLAVDSDEHAECVVALYEKDQELRAAKRVIMAPKKPPTLTDSVPAGGAAQPQDASGSGGVIPNRSDS